MLIVLTHADEHPELSSEEEVRAVREELEREGWCAVLDIRGVYALNAKDRKSKEFQEFLGHLDGVCGEVATAQPRLPRVYGWVEESVVERRHAGVMKLSEEELADCVEREHSDHALAGDYDREAVLRGIRYQADVEGLIVRVPDGSGGVTVYTDPQWLFLVLSPFVPHHRVRRRAEGHVCVETEGGVTNEHRVGAALGRLPKAFQSSVESVIRVRE